MKNLAGDILNITETFSDLGKDKKKNMPPCLLQFLQHAVSNSYENKQTDNQFNCQSSDLNIPYNVIRGERDVKSVNDFFHYSVKCRKLQQLKVIF